MFTYSPKHKNKNKIAEIIQVTPFKSLGTQLFKKVQTFTDAPEGNTMH